MTCKSQQNMGKLDRAFRFFIGFTLMGHGIYFDSPALVIVSLIILASAIAGICLLYKMVNIDTLTNKECTLAKKEEEESEKDHKEHSEKADQDFRGCC